MHEKMIERNLTLWLTGLLAFFLAGAYLDRVFGGAAEPQKLFKPPRCGVVDISQVFESYDKKKDRQEQFQAEIKAVEEKLKDLEKKYKEIVAEIPNLETGDKKKEKELEKFKLEQEVKDLKQSEMKRLRDTQIKFLQEIRDEIAEEIQTYAKANDLDLVLEKTVMAETGPEGGFRWPIVHYAKPEIDVTTEIGDRLNSRYRPRAGAVKPLQGTSKP